jgi:hypothetical protein
VIEDSEQILTGQPEQLVAVGEPAVEDGGDGGEELVESLLRAVQAQQGVGDLRRRSQVVDPVAAQNAEETLQERPGSPAPPPS